MEGFPVAVCALIFYHNLFVVIGQLVDDVLDGAFAKFELVEGGDTLRRDGDTTQLPISKSFAGNSHTVFKQAQRPWLLLAAQRNATPKRTQIYSDKARQHANINKIETDIRTMVAIRSNTDVGECSRTWSGIL